MKLYHLTGDAVYQKLAEETLECFTETYLNFGFMSAEYAMAVDAFLHEPTMIRIIGTKESMETKSFLDEAARVYEPRKIIQLLDPETDAKEIADNGFLKQDSTTAYVCVGRVCTAPITDPKLISPTVQKMVSAQIRD